jgi:hypothetical protein
MERLLARLERRLGRLAIPNLTYFLVGGMALVWVLALSRPGFLEQISLDMDAVRRGQVWRLVTFLFIPQSSSPFWIFFELWWFWLIGTNLESHWGAFKFNVYYGLGALGTIAAAAIVGGAGNTYLNATLFFAFATLFPDYELLLFFILPVKVKWLAALTAAGFLLTAALGAWPTRVAILVATGNYLLFFGPHLWSLWKHRNVVVPQQARRASFRPPPVAYGQRQCAICGAREADGTDIRVCSCEKCGGVLRDLCLEHARNH